jgi:hypothetical protein
MSEPSLTPDPTARPSDDALIAEVDFDALKDAAPDDAVQPVLADAEPPADEDDEAAQQQELARARGWVEQEKWKGKGWIDAKAYNERYEHVMPVVSRENKRLRAEMQERDATLTQVQSELAELRKAHQETVAARQNVEHDMLLSDRAKALEEQDYQAVVKIDDKLLEMKVSQHTAPKPAPKQGTIDPVVKRILDNFIEENPIFRDAKMQSVLNEQAVLMRASASPLVGREFLDEARERVERMYPERFRPAKRPAMAETSGSPSHIRNGARNWSDLRPEARDALDKMIRTTPDMMKLGLEKARASVLQSTDDSYFRK